MNNSRCVQFLLLAVITLLATSCAKTNPTPLTNDCGTTTLPPTYAAGIAPIMSTHCVSCHGNPSITGGVVLNTYAGVKTTTIPGGPAASPLYSSVYLGTMPPSYRLTSDQMNALCQWIKDGSLEN